MHAHRHLAEKITRRIKQHNDTVRRGIHPGWGNGNRDGYDTVLHSNTGDV